MVQKSKNLIVPRKNKMKILYMVENQKKIIVPRKNKIKIPYIVENQKNFIVPWKKSFRGGISWSMQVASVFVRKWLAILFNNYNSGMKLTTIHKYIIKIFIANVILVTRHESSFARIVSITIKMSVEFCIMYLFTNFIE